MKPFDFNVVSAEKNSTSVGLIKIEESIVEVQYREADKAIVSRVLPEAVQEFKQIMANAGINGNEVVFVNITYICQCALLPLTSIIFSSRRMTVSIANVQVTLAKTPIPNKGCTGGVILTALDGKIVLNQTTDERLSIGK